MPEISVHLLGKFHIDGVTTPQTALDAGKARELFCYLLLHRDRPVPREMLAGTLWAGSPNDHARKYLRQALWQLQSGLSSLSESQDRRLLQVESGWVRLDSRAGLWLDVSVVEHAFGASRGVPGRELSAGQADVLRSAVTLYHGELLEGWYQEWCTAHREALQASYFYMLDKLVAHCEAHDEYEQGMAFADSILQLDRAHERTHRRLMRLHYQIGDRTRALRQYDRCVAALHDELGIQPARRTTDLYEKMRLERWPAPPPPPTTVTDSGNGLETLADVADRLRHVQSSLAELENQVWLQLQAVETVLVPITGKPFCATTDSSEAQR